MKRIIILINLFFLLINLELFSNDIWQASREGNLAEVQKFIEKVEVDINVKDSEGNTPLYYAVKENKIEIIKYLISKKANPNIVNNKKETPLFLTNNFDCIKLLLENKCDPNIKNENGDDFLSNLFSGLDNIEILKYLIEKKINLNKVNKYNSTSLSIKSTPLIFFTISHNFDAVYLLVENGVSINQKCDDKYYDLYFGKNLLEIAYTNCSLKKLRDFNDFKILNFIKDQTFSYKSKEGKIITEKLKINQQFFKDVDDNEKLKIFVALEDLNAIKNFIKKGINPDYITESFSYKDFSAIDISLIISNKDILNYFLSIGYIDFTKKDTFIKFCQYASEESVKWLIDKNIKFENIKLDEKEEILTLERLNNDDINLKTILEKCLASNDILNAFLMISINNNKFQTTEYLLKIGTDSNYKNENGESPLFIACDKNFLDIVKLLIKNGSNINALDNKGNDILISLCSKNLSASVDPVENETDSNNQRYEIISFLIDNGIDINSQNNNNECAVILSYENKMYDVTKLLIIKGANINILDKDGNTFLSRVYKNETYLNRQQSNGSSYDLLNLMIDNKVDLNSYDDDENLLIINAVENNKIELINLLIKNNVNVNLKNKKNETALSKALDNNYLDIVSILIENGADINTIDKNGNPIIFSSLKTNGFPLTKLLLDKGADANSIDKNGIPVLVIASEKELNSTAKLLIEKGANVNITNKNGVPLLIFVCEKNNFEIAKALIENKADVNIKNKNGKTALDRIKKNFGADKIINLLKENGAE